MFGPRRCRSCFQQVRTAFRRSGPALDANRSSPALTVAATPAFYNRGMSVDTFAVLRGVFAWANELVQAQPLTATVGLSTVGFWLVWQVVTLALPQRRA